MKRLSGLILLLVVAGCGDPKGTETGNAMRIRLAATSSAQTEGSSPAAPDAQGTIFTIEQARIWLRYLELELPEGTQCSDYDTESLETPVFCDDESGEASFRVQGPYVADLLARTATPELRGLTIPEAAYQRVDVRLDPGEADEGLLGPDDPLLGNAIDVTGTFDYEGQTYDFVIRLAFSEDARFAEMAGIRTRRILLALDVADWFGDLPITECLDNGDLTINNGRLVIGNGTGDCSDIENELTDAIRDSGELEEDPEDED